MTAVIIGFIAVWSCYIVAISEQLKSRSLATSLEGMSSSAQVGVAYTFGFVPFQIAFFDLHVSFWTIGPLLMGVPVATAFIGFFVGFSKARLQTEIVKAFLFRQLGVLLGTLILASFVVVAFRYDSDWAAMAWFVLAGCSGILLTALYIRAARQRKRYMARRTREKRPAPEAKGYTQPHVSSLA